MQIICSYTPTVHSRITRLEALSHSAHGMMFLSNAHSGVATSEVYLEHLPAELGAIVKWWTSALGIERYYELLVLELILEKGLTNTDYGFEIVSVDPVNGGVLLEPPAEFYSGVRASVARDYKSIRLDFGLVPSAVQTFIGASFSGQEIFESLLARLEWSLTQIVVFGRDIEVILSLPDTAESRKAFENAA